jgi:hypothetical protein
MCVTIAGVVMGLWTPLYRYAYLHGHNAGYSEAWEQIGEHHHKDRALGQADVFHWMEVAGYGICLDRDWWITPDKDINPESDYVPVFRFNDGLEFKWLKSRKYWKETQ